MDDELRQSLAEIKAALKQEMAVVRAEAAEAKREILDTVAELVRDAQTEILKAFFSFQEANSLRMRKLEADNSNLNTSLSERMGVLERRLQEIEKRLFMKSAGYSAMTSSFRS